MALPKKAARRKAIPLPIQRQVLHEAGYRCSNPACRTIITVDIHHIEFVAKGGKDEPANLLPLCPTCHQLHHKGIIPVESIRTWKMILLSLNEGFPSAAVDWLLALEKVNSQDLKISTDQLLTMGSLLASGLIECTPQNPLYEWSFISLSEKGRLFISAWKKGDQERAIAALTPRSGP